MWPGCARNRVCRTSRHCATWSSPAHPARARPPWRAFWAGSSPRSGCSAAPRSWRPNAQTWWGSTWAPRRSRPTGSSTGPWAACCSSTRPIHWSTPATAAATRSEPRPSRPCSNAPRTTATDWWWCWRDTPPRWTASWPPTQDWPPGSTCGCGSPPTPPTNSPRSPTPWRRAPATSSTTRPGRTCTASSRTCARPDGSTSWATAVSPVPSTRAPAPTGTCGSPGNWGSRPPPPT